MSGYIDNSTGEALWESYQGGRAESGKKLPESGHLAQWSSLMDAATCDWCGWADERIFNTYREPYEPPMHWGCRCILAHIKITEFQPTPDWGKGPPRTSWPPGTKYKPGGPAKPKPPPIDKQPKPKPPKPKPKPKPKRKPKPEPKPEPTKYVADTLKTQKELEFYLREELGVHANLDGLSLRNQQDIVRTIEKYQKAYPKQAGALHEIATTQTPRQAHWSFDGEELAAHVKNSYNVEAATNIRGGSFRGTQIAIRKGIRSSKPSAYVSGGGYEGVMWHELGHAYENYIFHNIKTAATLYDDVLKTVYKGDVALFGKDLTGYAMQDGHEFIAELFHIVNRPGGIKAWSRTAAQEARIRETLEVLSKKRVKLWESQT